VATFAKSGPGGLLGVEEAVTTTIFPKVNWLIIFSTFATSRRSWYKMEGGHYRPLQVYPSVVA